MKKHTARFAILAALLFAGTAVFAADTGNVKKHDLTLKSGKVLKDAYILDKKPNGITFGHKDGCSFVRFSDMPEKAQKYFNYRDLSQNTQRIGARARTGRSQTSWGD